MVHMNGLATSPLLLLLGSPNDEQGNLSAVAKARVGEAVKAHREASGRALLPTGGFGEHFNTSDDPHYFHLTTALIAEGVSANLILAGVPSANTAQDAIGACQRARDLGYSSLEVITSDFHGERARLLFDRVRCELSVRFRLASSDHLDRGSIDALIEHERTAIQRLGA